MIPGADCAGWFEARPMGDLPGGPVAETPRFHCRAGPGSTPARGTEIPRAAIEQSTCHNKDGKSRWKAQHSRIRREVRGLPGGSPASTGDVCSTPGPARKTPPAVGEQSLRATAAQPELQGLGTVAAEARAPQPESLPFRLAATSADGGSHWKLSPWPGCCLFLPNQTLICEGIWPV